MGNRCPDCNKFVGLEMADPETDQVEISSVEARDDEGKQEVHIGGSVRLVLNCAECGTEMAETEPDVEGDATFQHDEPDCDGEIELEVSSAMETDDYRPPGRPARYQTHYWGADLEIELTCSKCQGTETVNITVEEAAGCFDELV